jgi:S-methylmethionine-dependent homocysteine/selenocysteine methylase
MQALLVNHDLILAEAAIVEPLRRRNDVELHPGLVHAPLIYDDKGAKLLRSLYESYMDVAMAAGLPFMMCTPTWRTNWERVRQSGFPDCINGDAVRFLQEIRGDRELSRDRVKIGGIIGCRNDTYKPEEGLSTSDAERFHDWQIAELVRAEVDFLIAETIPKVEEAAGIARAMEKSGAPYFMSFVINREGRVLDGTTLPEAVAIVDGAVGRKPLGYMFNCAYPGFLCAERQPAALFERLVGCLGNASSLDHCDLEGAEELQAESVEEWCAEMLLLNREYGVKVLGGCCGTGVEHLRRLCR